MKHVVIRSLFALLAAQSLTACSGSRGSTSDPFLPPETRNQEEEAIAGPECVDQDDKPVVCSADDECCEGFVCGKDPELNHRNKYCIYGG